METEGRWNVPVPRFEGYGYIHGHAPPPACIVTYHTSPVMVRANLRTRGPGPSPPLLTRRVYSIDTRSGTYRTRPHASEVPRYRPRRRTKTRCFVDGRECSHVYTIDTPNLEAPGQKSPSISLAHLCAAPMPPGARHNRSSRRKKARRKRALTLSRKIVQKCSPELA